MDLRNQQIKETFGNLATINTVAGTPTTGVLQNGAGSNVTTLTIAGTLDATTLGGTLSTAAQTNITSVGTLSGLGVSGATGLDGAVTINESGANVDFRVEGDTDANLLLVDASADRVGIGTGAPFRKLGVYANQDGIILSHGFSLSDYSEIAFHCDGVVGSGAIIRSYRANDSFVGNEGDLRFYTNTGTNTASDTAVERMRIDSSGNVGIGTSSPVSGKLQINHSNTENGIYILQNNAGLLLSGVENFGGLISAAAIRFETSSTERFLVKTAEVVVNDPSNDVDFRVEGNGDTHLIFADAGNDRVGIGTSSPLSTLHVSGDMQVTDQATIGYTKIWSGSITSITSAQDVRFALTSNRVQESFLVTISIQMGLANDIQGWHPAAQYMFRFLTMDDGSVTWQGLTPIFEYILDYTTDVTITDGGAGTYTVYFDIANPVGQTLTRSSYKVEVVSQRGLTLTQSVV